MIKVPNKKRSSLKVENPFLFFAVLLLLFISITVAAIGSQRKAEQSQQQSQKEEGVIREDSSLNQFFEKEFSEIGDLDNESEFEQNDPFKQTCLDTAGDDLPSISGNTVCLR